MNPLGLFLEPPGPLLTHLHTVYMVYSERLPTRLNPLAERTCCSQVRRAADYSKKDWWAEYLDGCLDDINPERDDIGTYLKADGTILHASETRFRAKGCDERHAGYKIIIKNTTPSERRAVRSPIVSMLAPRWRVRLLAADGPCCLVGGE